MCIIPSASNGGGGGCLISTGCTCMTACVWVVEVEVESNLFVYADQRKCDGAAKIWVWIDAADDGALAF